VYVPDYFKPADDDVRELLRNHGAVDLITSTASGLRATMLPMVWIEPDGTSANGEHGRLVGHVARKNDHWREPAAGEALAIVRGPDGYISPSWYAAKREHGRVVPTWNYVIAHVRGTLVVHDDAAWVEGNVRLLTAKHERSRTPGWSVDDAPPEYIAGQLRAIVGMELLISSIEAKFKLNQNRSQADVDGAIAGLEHDGRDEIAAAMRAANISGEQS
jgi:transcriptional regulator